MMDLRCIAERYNDAGELPTTVQAHAKAAICGIIFCNGFAGRCMEWPLLTLAHFREQVESNKEYILCFHPQDSTRLRRPRNVDSTRHACVDALLCTSASSRRMCPLLGSCAKHDRRLQRARVVVPCCPQILAAELHKTNRQLVEEIWLSTTQDSSRDSCRRALKLCEFEALCTSRARRPSLSAALVKAVLGEPVLWPSHHSVTDVEAMSKGLAGIPWDVEAEIGDQVHQDADNADTDDVVFDWWEFGAVFWRHEAV